ncbi:MAG: response regulator [Gammaproteobacteria bacterium]|jgi:two-component system response regulator AtoC|nr:response regulator [Gammaproteobacteria bacterium]
MSGDKGLRVLVIDDEAAICQVLADAIRRGGFDVDYVNDGEQALETLRGGDFDIALCDIKMPGIDGIEMVRQARDSGIDTTFLMMTAYASVSTAIEAMRAGAYDYMIKPLRNEDVLRRLDQIADIISLRDENRTLRDIVFGDDEGFCAFESEPMRKIDRLVLRVAPSESSVLITGESGTGKGVIARAVHNHSKRRNALFLPVNCGAIPENLLESELFGHVKGAFTGAERAKKGLFVEADRGTLFLDEIGELPLAMQVKLLHILEDMEVRAVGSEKSRKVDVRVIAATNRDLAADVESGAFRQDLYFRLNVVHLHIPPLRERQGDIAQLIRHFLRRHADQFGQGEPYVLDAMAEQLLLNHAWPGNVRELENVIERAHILADDEHIGVADLPPHLARGDSMEGAPKAALQDLDQSLRDRVRAFEVGVIQEAIDEADGDRKVAARRLGIGLSTLYRKLEEEIANP